MQLKDLIDQLSQESAYPHPVQRPIETVQTHCSIVFLTGDYAYKLKKPVDFGFLDFSTLAKRQYFLNEELRLNQAIAPDIYDRVVPIYQMDGGRLGLPPATGQVVEYALRMHQFPQDCLLVNRFQQGKLQPEDMQALGIKVAQFHSQTSTNAYIASFGHTASLKTALEDNFRATEKYIGIVQNAKQYEQTRAFSQQCLQTQEPIFEERIHQQKVRECHGDLHLKNICYWHGTIQLFDRIEFNESFRFVDVMYDIAFVVMDLEARNRPDLANIFLNTYLEQTGDWLGVQILPFYLCRQAYVRAKVTSFLLDDAQIAPPAKEEAKASAQNYYHLAWHYGQPRRGGIILMCGLSGAGKSTVARFLAPHLGALHLRSDAVRKQLAGLPLEERGNEALYGEEMTQKTYTKLAELAFLLASQGFQVILDAKYDRRLWRSHILQSCQTQNLPCSILYCQAPVEVLGDRLLQRRGDISDATPTLLEQQQQNFEAFTPTEQDFLLTLHTQDWRWQNLLLERFAPLTAPHNSDNF
jgi:hypothetical protein